jgi:hypothetical protein
VLVGCERSRQIHRHFYGDEPPGVEMCPRDLVTRGPEPILPKCCDLEFGVVQDATMTVVPWGATLEEVHAGLRRLVAEQHGSE